MGKLAETLPPGHRVARLWRRWVGVVLGSLAGALVCASGAPAQILIRPPREELAIVSGRLVWVDRDRVLLKGFRSGSTTLGDLDEEGFSGSPALASSDNAVAMSRLGPTSSGQGRGFLAGIPPGRFARIPQPEPIAGGGCERWVPATGSASDFDVVGEELIAAGECEGEPDVVGEQGTATRQPLFVRGLRGGTWRVLLWLDGNSPPILAAEGSLLAVGVQVSLAKMRVVILDLAPGRVEGRFDSPDAYLSFASSKRLVLAVPTLFWSEEAAFPFSPQVGGHNQLGGPRSYRLELYSVRGRHLAELGASSQLPLVSHMHLLSQEPVEGGSVLAVRSVLGGEPKRVIGFKEPARSLVAEAFRWPAVVVVETTRAALSQSEVTCESGEYHAASEPFLGVFDVARSEPFVPPPPSAHLVLPAPETCPLPRLVHALAALQTPNREDGDPGR